MSEVTYCAAALGAEDYGCSVCTAGVTADATTDASCARYAQGPCQHTGHQRGMGGDIVAATRKTSSVCVG